MLEIVLTTILAGIASGVFILWALALYLLNEANKGLFQHRRKNRFVTKIERYWNVSA